MHASLTRPHGGRTLRRGFSLIELMVVVVLVAILASVAYPSYSDYVRRLRRTDATLLLSLSAQRLERCRAECNSYTAAACASACPVLPLTSADGYYQIGSTDSSVTAGAFTLVAKPVAGRSQAQDGQCASFSLNQLKQKSAQSAAGSDTTAICWK